MKKALLLLLVLLLAALAIPGRASAKDKLGSIQIEPPIVNYGSAYRDGTWAPVDVVVKNDDFNITGWVEVRLLAGNTAQSPIYRLPADLPKGSRKRFRFNCYLKGTTRIEAMVYNGKRPVMELPTYVAVTPVSPRDVLCLVLDEEPTDFSFLYTALMAEAKPPVQPRPGDPSQPDASENRRLHRESLKNETLPFLADHPECYEPFDLIVAGNIEPDRIAERHRTLLRRYVEKGGVLVVCTGSNGAKYRNSWIEQWAGVSVGAQEAIAEGDLTQAAFPGSAPATLHADRQCVLCQLLPVVPDVKQRGDRKVLATLRPIGLGCVVVVGVDASSHALQDCPEYLAMWDQLYSFRRNRGAVNLDNAGQFCVQALPSVSGVHINPSESVAGYLFLYLMVGVVGNWLFFNRLKRRELAWVALIFFSLCFTAYAMIFGAAGRAKQNEIEQVRVLHLPRGGDVASRTEFVGALSTRSTTRSMKISSEFALARDTGVTRMPWAAQYGMQGGAEAKPFSLVQGKAGFTIENLVLGASEIRVLQVQSEVTFPGGVEGRVFQQDGHWQATVKNHTGMRIVDAAVLLDGRLYRLPPIDTEWEGRLSELANLGANVEQGYGYTPYAPYGGRPPASYNGGQPLGDVQNFRSQFPLRLFSEDSYRFELSPALGPLLCGWVSTPPASAIAFDKGMLKGVEETFVVAEIGIERPRREETTWRYLQTSLAMGEAPPRGMGGGPNMPAGPITLNSQGGVVTAWIAVPEWLLRSDADDILVDVSWSSADTELSFSAAQSSTGAGQPQKWVDVSRDSSAAETADVRTPASNLATRAAFRIADWRRNYLVDRTYIMARITSRPVLGLAGPNARAPRNMGVGNVQVQLQVQSRVKWTLGQDPSQGGLTGWR
jgi:hypothetical protein